MEVTANTNVYTPIFVFYQTKLTFVIIKIFYTFAAALRFATCDHCLVVADPQAQWESPHVLLVSSDEPPRVSIDHPANLTETEPKEVQFKYACMRSTVRTMHTYDQLR